MSLTIPDIVRRWSVIDAFAHYTTVLRNLLMMMTERSLKLEAAGAFGAVSQEIHHSIILSIVYELTQRAVPHVASFCSRKVIP